MDTIQLEIGWGKRVQVELNRELGASFGVCIVGGTVSNIIHMISFGKCLMGHYPISFPNAHVYT